MGKLPVVRRSCLVLNLCHYTCAAEPPQERAIRIRATSWSVGGGSETTDGRDRLARNLGADARC